jgi:predicted secreted protein
MAILGLQLRRRLGLWVASAGLFLGTGGVCAFADEIPRPEGVVSLSAFAQREASRDVLSITLTAIRDANEANSVQTQLKQILDTALTEAKKSIQLPGLDVRTGAFSLVPRYGSNGRINGWQGAAELIIEGKDLQKVAQLAGKLQGMNVSSVTASLSKEMREQYEAEVASAAIQKFRTRAASLAKDFGYRDYVVREVNVQTGDTGAGQNMLMTPSAAIARADLSGTSSTPLPVSPGKSNVTVTVSGSVQLKY